MEGGDGDRSGIYRPPRLAAMPYVDAPLKGKNHLPLFRFFPH